MDFDNVEDFTRGFLHLAELMHVVPELGFGNDGVRCEDDHTVCLRVWVFGGGGFAAHHLELIQLSSSDSHFSITKFLSKMRKQSDVRNLFIYFTI